MEKKGVYRLYVRFHQIIMNLSTKLFVQCSSPLIKHSKNRFEKKMSANSTIFTSFVGNF